MHCINLLYIQSFIRSTTCHKKINIGKNFTEVYYKTIIQHLYCFIDVLYLLNNRLNYFRSKHLVFLLFFEAYPLPPVLGRCVGFFFFNILINKFLFLRHRIFPVLQQNSTVPYLQASLCQHSRQYNRIVIKANYYIILQNYHTYAI